MADLVPFRGLRYRAVSGRIDDLVAPPYDVISADDRAVLAARSPHNAVHLEVPVEESGADRYEVAASLWRDWRRDGVLALDDEPSFYVYRMGYRDEGGRPRQTTGVLGALRLEPPGTGILPHEHTTAKDAADRLDLLRATRANLSPIWTLAEGGCGLSTLAEPTGPPDCRATDEQGVHHRLWRVTSPARIVALTEAVAAGPVLVADGHHRYEVALRHQGEMAGPGGHDHVMSYVVELSDDELSVRAIHRLVSGLPDGFDLPGALGGFFELSATGGPDASLVPRMAEAGALALATPDGTWLMVPRPEAVAAAPHDLDSSRLDLALSGLPPHHLRFQHGWDLAAAAVAGGGAQAAVFLRPATVDQIAAVGHGGDRMPPKTTYFHPKPATGMVFRSLD